MTTKSKRKVKTLAHVKKLSQLLAIGLRDLRKQERAPKSEVDMAEWLTKNGKCVACVAGSVLRFSLGVKPKHRMILSECVPEDSREYRLMRTLNYLRSGWIENASYAMGVPLSIVSDREVPKYDGPNGEWWAAMRKLLADLKAAGE